jgi:hypothetical protein
MSKSKCQYNYNFEQIYLVIKELDEDILYVGTLLEISKYLNLGIKQILNYKSIYSNILESSINIIEALTLDDVSI